MQVFRAKKSRPMQQRYASLRMTAPVIVNPVSADLSNVSGFTLSGWVLEHVSNTCQTGAKHVSKRYHNEQVKEAGEGGDGL